MDRRDFLTGLSLGIGGLSMGLLGVKPFSSEETIKIRLQVDASRDLDAVDVVMQVPKGTTVFQVTAEKTQVFSVGLPGGHILRMVNGLEVPYFRVNEQEIRGQGNVDYVLSDGDAIHWSLF